MGFSLYEIANFLGRRICLYEFIWGNNHYRYTNADRIVTWGLDENDEPANWLPIGIKDNGHTHGVERQDFVIELPRSVPVIDLFRTTPPSLPIAIICRRYHKDDPDQEATVYWTGTIGNVRGRDAIRAEIIGLSVTDTMRRTGARLSWQRQCPHALYDEGCRVNREMFKTTTTILALSGTSLTVASTGAFNPSLYSGGFLEWTATAEGTIDRRAIERADGPILHLLGTTDRLVVGQAVSLFLGCDLAPTTCGSIFNNLPNHGGFLMLADKSPFDGNPVF
jgi:uncharacterized phage protein (TIGR02218 family)